MSLIRGEMIRKHWVQREELSAIHLRLMADTFRADEEQRKIEKAQLILEQFEQVWL